MTKGRDVFAGVTVLALVLSAGCTAFKRFTYVDQGMIDYLAERAVEREVAVAQLGRALG